MVIIVIRGKNSKSKENISNWKLLREVEPAFIECLLWPRDYAVHVIQFNLQNNSLRRQFYIHLPNNKSKSNLSKAMRWFWPKMASRLNC